MTIRAKANGNPEKFDIIFEYKRTTSFILLFSLLGGTKKDFWLRIGLPILKSSIIGTTIILFTNAIGAYATVFGIMTSNYNVIPIRIGALISGDVILKPNMASALAIMLIIIISVVFFVNEKFIQRRKY